MFAVFRCDGDIMLLFIFPRDPSPTWRPISIVYPTFRFKMSSWMLNGLDMELKTV